MNKLFYIILPGLLLAGCTTQSPQRDTSTPKRNMLISQPAAEITDEWMLFTDLASQQYDVDVRLINAIINVESGGNPKAISRSRAMGLMQIKASTAGREVWQARGWTGEPQTSELLDPAKNIDIGTAYLQLLQQRALKGIQHPETLRYATIVAYANGAGALLRTFSASREQAITKINALTPEQFIEHIQQKHPAAQAPRYLWKVTTAYRSG